LNLVPPIDTSVPVTADQDGHLTDEQRAAAVNMNSEGRYRINIWAINEGNEAAVLASVYSVEVTPRDDDGSAPQIFFFQPDSESGYKAQEYRFSMETTGNVAKVDLYIDEYLVSAAIERELWNGFHFYELTAPIWEAGTRECRVVVTSLSGETAQAVCRVVVEDADYAKLPTPVFTSPALYKDGVARGVIHSAFTVAWEEDAALAGSNVTIRVYRGSECVFSQSVTGTNSVQVSDAALGEVGEYTVTMVATALGYESSDFAAISLRAYSSELAIVQELCPHEGEPVRTNQRLVWKNTLSYDGMKHYYQEFCDLACPDCGYTLEANHLDMPGYQSAPHTLINSSYCVCGYCTGYGEDGDTAFLNDGADAPIYRTPDRSNRIGYLYPYDEVLIHNQVGEMYYISYYSDVYETRRYGFVSMSHIENTISFTVRDKNGSVRIGGVTAGFGFDANGIAYTVPIGEVMSAFDLSVEYDDASRLSGTLSAYNEIYNKTVSLGFDLTDNDEGEWEFSRAIALPGNLISKAVDPDNTLVRFGRLASKVVIFLEDLCVLTGYDYQPQNALCIKNNRAKADIMKELEKNAQGTIDAVGKLRFGIISEIAEGTSNATWFLTIPGDWLGNMLAHGVIEGTVEYTGDIGKVIAGEEYMGDEIVALLLDQKILELEGHYLTAQGEANSFISVLREMKELFDEPAKFKDLITGIISLSNKDFDLLLKALFEDKNGESYRQLSLELQDIYNTLRGNETLTQTLMTKFTDVCRAYNNNFLLQAMFSGALEVVDFFSDADAKKQHNMVYLKYREELIAELNRWAKTYEDKERMYKSLTKAIGELEKLEVEEDAEWKAYLDSGLEHGVKFAASLAVKAAEKGLILKGATTALSAVPYVGIALEIIEVVNTVAELIGMDIEAAVDARAAFQACLKYYNDMYKTVSTSVREVKGLTKDDAIALIDNINDCMYWQSVMMRCISDMVTGLSPDNGWLTKLIDEFAAGKVEEEIRDARTSVKEYISLLEEYHDI
ncbi:MAG: hypothetical protein Q4D04_13015, partial [Clostridia bacterium]|nr:hypothetical protein [Clostridia bacterium]